jgi:hypothetical protein
MNDVDPTRILERLLAVTLASRDAFDQAAQAIKSPGLAALCVLHAAEQARIATYLGEQLAETGPPAPPSRPSADRTTLASESPSVLPAVHDSSAILCVCVSVLDTSILEFSRAYGPAPSLVEHRPLDRHHDRMRWARKELAHLRSTFVTHTASGRADAEVQWELRSFRAPNVADPTRGSRAGGGSSPTGV